MRIAPRSKGADIECYNKLIYLHAALCEALRLYPSVPFQAKVPMELDILQSGHQLDPSMQIIISMYAMGRIKSIWGEDCYEFKPERWISEGVLAFNAGPRTCIGKNMAFIQMKAVAATTISSYRIQAVPRQTVIPNVSIILRMKHGFKVMVSPA
ncbi:hypothetical protein Cgig2_024368 [Carnegiea gigantea]|uniref:Cytochrome P450 n=1 Tax=Carnegiea gigantea TaxID=171969 RepID=A0A9Q1JM39_9CARY|nr:hypothetical protein Cgig2_024368 [Carnegiea gigantea]